jgi:membrane protein required for beta-lactamase induction
MDLPVQILLVAVCEVTHRFRVFQTHVQAGAGFGVAPLQFVPTLITPTHLRSVTVLLTAPLYAMIIVITILRIIKSLFHQGPLLLWVLLPRYPLRYLLPRHPTPFPR